ncbi:MULTISPECIES: energy-coupling factor transporter transmembrane component T family protein [Microbacterium]|uniref:Energy-coupling factor transport system permease protein n=1 Tax=Microbacterium saccharophilum TaxID=1213358 RepID=A0A7Z7CYJ8_9MICO|nr:MULTISPECIES: energy-coupling factor transporter transmembrane component T [Microbacterium]SFI60619.1 energy-coupling factor transport system permease protein [Microbacterium saccharophilum]
MSVVVDPYAEVAIRRRFLDGLNPLAKLAGPLPAVVLLVFVRDLVTPLIFLALAYVVILAGARLTRTVGLILGLALPLGVVVFGVGMSVWIDASRIDRSVEIVSIGAWTLYGGALEIGFATSLRLAAIVALALIAGLTTTGPDLVRASVQQLRVPYRVGYTALAAFRFVPRFRHELDIIRQAHRVRGAHGGRFGVVARWWGYVVPLLAGAIRHAERVALAMDARAFGAHPDRTERHLVPFRVRDAVFLGACWAVSAVVLTAPL